MKLQRLLSLTRKAIDEFSMIEEGDRIAVGVSGGKDSLTLLYALGELKKFYPKRFTVEAPTVSLGYENFDLSGVQEAFRKAGDSHITVLQSGNCGDFCLKSFMRSIRVRCVQGFEKVHSIRKQWNWDVIRLRMRTA